MIYYLTYNDVPSGIYSSQVIDVVKILKKELNTEIRLVSLISLRGFIENKKKIQAELQDAIVIPMFPGVKRWRKNYFLLSLLCAKYKPQLIIARSVLATQIAIKLREAKKVKKIIYDGRGAIAAEWKEYHVISDSVMLSQIHDLERSSIIDSDFRIAVSEQLIKHWQQTYHYNLSDHVIIPCTLNAAFLRINLDEPLVLKSRSKLGFNEQDIVLAYSGSVAGWQSFQLLYDFLKPLLSQNLNVKLLFLSDNDINISKIQREFPGRVIREKVSSSEVPDYLMAADYGLLIREITITNKVASPVKFAEYLSCGLSVIISDNLGDYSEFVKQNNCGELYQNIINIKSLSLFEKQRNRALALQKFTKSSHLVSYRKCLTLMDASD